MDKISLSEKFTRFDEHWSPKLIGELNGQYVKLAKGKGELVWHTHVEEDEFFLVISGRLHLHFRDRITTLNPGECCIVPRGIEHKPAAEGEVHILSSNRSRRVTRANCSPSRRWRWRTPTSVSSAVPPTLFKIPMFWILGLAPPCGLTPP